MMRKGVKEASADTVLTPRFYTTDFDEMERLFSLELNPNIDMAEIEACLREFRTDYNQTHFVRNDSFKKAADNVQGDELGRRLKKTSPAVAEIFSLMSRDEARHAGFINKAMGDFNLALDLGFLTKNRKYTFFKPKFIFYATYLSEKIGYWRYISIYRHLQRNPDCQLYPMFEYFENWCQDENRHGDFFTAILKTQPAMINDWQSRQWSKFFCLSVYVTMYLNDHQRDAFYSSLGMNTTQFNQHVIIETNNTTARIFPEVPDCEAPKFWAHMDKLVVLNGKLSDIGKSSAPQWQKNLQKVPIFQQFAWELGALFFGKSILSGTYDGQPQTQLVY
ncbi:hypothetical protein WJX79_007240 [Trebouxia sp. C0005]